MPLAVSVLHGLLLQVDNMCSAYGCFIGTSCWCRYIMCAVPLAVSVLHGLLLQLDNMCPASGCYLWHILLCRYIMYALPLAGSVLHGLLLQVDNCMLRLWLLIVCIPCFVAGTLGMPCLWQ